MPPRLLGRPLLALASSSRLALASLLVPRTGVFSACLAAPTSLQGTGKTTAAGKLALYMKKRGMKVLLVATDVYRPGEPLPRGAPSDQLATRHAPCVAACSASG